MSFKSYLIRPSGAGLALVDPQPLVFSGRQGLIARFVTAERERAFRQWCLGGAELHGLASPPLSGSGRMIVFEQIEEDAVELLTLESVRGVSSERTDMMFTFRPLRVVHRTPALVVEAVTGGLTYTEELTLDGGVLALAAQWRWRRPHLALGGVVCGLDTGRDRPAEC